MVKKTNTGQIAFNRSFFSFELQNLQQPAGDLYGKNLHHMWQRLCGDIKEDKGVKSSFSTN